MAQYLIIADGTVAGEVEASSVKYAVEELVSAKGVPGSGDLEVYRIADSRKVSVAPRTGWDISMDEERHTDFSTVVSSEH